MNVCDHRCELQSPPHERLHSSPPASPGFSRPCLPEPLLLDAVSIFHGDLMLLGFFLTNLGMVLGLGSFTKDLSLLLFFLFYYGVSLFVCLDKVYLHSPGIAVLELTEIQLPLCWVS